MLGLGVDFREGNFGVLFGRRFERRSKGLAGAAPFGPKINEHDAVGCDGLLKLVTGEIDCCHELFSLFGGTNFNQPGKAPIPSTPRGRVINGIQKTRWRRGQQAKHFASLKIKQRGTWWRHGREPFYPERARRAPIVVALHNSDSDHRDRASHLIVFDTLCDEAEPESIGQRDD